VTHTVLVVEDNTDLAYGLRNNLEIEGYRVVVATNGSTGLATAKKEQPDLMILDLMLPEMDGFRVLRSLRQDGCDWPILILTARGEEADKVRGLRLGADDYVTKPFATRELLARVEALGRRVQTPAHELRELEVDGCRIDLGKCVAHRADRSISLTAREVDILRWLFHHRSRAVSRSELLQVVWGSPGDLRTRTVDMTIANLRQKIERDPSRPEIVVTVKGVGYTWGCE